MGREEGAAAAAGPVAGRKGHLQQRQPSVSLSRASGGRGGAKGSQEPHNAQAAGGEGDVWPGAGVRPWLSGSRRRLLCHEQNGVPLQVGNLEGRAKISSPSDRWQQNQTPEKRRGAHGASPAQADGTGQQEP